MYKLGKITLDFFEMVFVQADIVTEEPPQGANCAAIPGVTKSKRSRDCQKRSAFDNSNLQGMSLS